MIRRTVAAICVTAAIAILGGISLTGVTTTIANAVPGSTEPSSPGGPGGPNNGGDLPPDSPGDQTSKMEKACNDALSSLRKVPVSSITKFGGSSSVMVAPVCDHGFGKGANIDNAQAAPLIDSIAKNPIMVAALKARGFTPDDVVGVVVINGVATLYVHHHAAV